MYQLEESFRILRVTLEGRYDGPSIFAVTSAHRGDGAAYVAAGLARAFAESGEETLLVGASEHSANAELSIAENTRGTLTPLGVMRQSPVFSQLHVLTLAPASRERPVARDIETMLAEMRETHRAIVVAADPVPRSASALQFARAADGVLISIRFGRSPLPADRELVRLLDESGVQTIGVVPTRGRRAAAVVRGSSTSIVPVEYDGSSRLATRKVEVAS